MALERRIAAALHAGQTNYPPAEGLPELRESIRDFYRDRLGLEYPLSSILVASGARPLIYSAFSIPVDPGDRVVYASPSWNNDHYCHLAAASPVTAMFRRTSESRRNSRTGGLWPDSPSGRFAVSPRKADLPHQRLHPRLVFQHLV